MTYKRQITLLIAIALILFLLPVKPAYAQPELIYETSSEHTVTSGVTLEKIKRLTVDGWFGINILRVDLSNPYIEVDAISNPESLKKLTPVKTLADLKGAVAAVNGGFFNPLSDGNGYPDGMVVESGEITSAFAEFNRYGDIMSSFSIDGQNNVMYDFWKSDVTLVTPGGGTIAVTQYNKPSRLSYNDFTIFDRKWNGVSIGQTEQYPDIVEMVVDEGCVVEIREGQPAAEIPANGYVVVTRQDGGILLKESFKPGDTAQLDIATNPDWNDIKASVTGSSILVKDGRIPDAFSYDSAYLSKKQPRTVIGSSKDGKQLFLVTIDGRLDSSIGMTQMETAEFMLGLGAYNALNLDGGGSTTMVARSRGSNMLETVNSPSEGIARAVSNALGIFSAAPPAPLEGLIIDTEDKNLFAGTSRAFIVRGYDRYFNPVEVDPEEVKWSVTGIKGHFEGNIFYPESIGEGKILAQVKDAKGYIEISSLSHPVQLKLSDRLIKLSLNQSKSFTVTGVNKNGYGAKINPEDINWSLEGDIGRLDGNVFTALSAGTGYIEAFIGDTHAYCAVSVAEDTIRVMDSFETKNASFLSYPAYVMGGYALSNKEKHSGSCSGKLNYNFTDSEETQAAYIVFPDGGIPLDIAVSKIGVWVYNTHTNSNWLRAEVYDSKGGKHLVGILKNMDWTGWKYVEASLEGINEPSRLTRLYIAKVHPVADAGNIYFDDLTVISTASGYPDIDPAQVPSDTVPQDEANKAVKYQESDDSFRFVVFGDSHTPETPLQNLLVKGLSDKINKESDVLALVGSGTHSIAVSFDKPAVITGTGYNSFDVKNSRFIQLDMSKHSLRQSSHTQWQWYLKQLDSFEGDNVFIFLSDSPGSFTDKLEAGLFKEILTEYRKETDRNVWVFHKAGSNESYMERGVKYVTSAGLNTDGLLPDNADTVLYILVTVKGQNVTFEFKPAI